MLVELDGSEHPVALPATPAGVAATDLAALATTQHPERLGPAAGAWRLQDPRVSEGDTTVPTLNGTDMAAALRAGALDLSEQLFLVWSDNADAIDEGAVGAAGSTTVVGAPPRLDVV